VCVYVLVNEETLPLVPIISFFSSQIQRKREHQIKNTEDGWGNPTKTPAQLEKKVT
jgi:hypothetical protein